MKKIMPFLGVILLAVAVLQVGCQADHINCPVGDKSTQWASEKMVALGPGEVRANEGAIITDADPWKNDRGSEETTDGEGDDDDDDDNEQTGTKKEETKETEAAPEVKKKIVDSIGTFMQMWRDR